MQRSRALLALDVELATTVDRALRDSYPHGLTRSRSVSAPSAFATRPRPPGVQGS
ncbi:hypothetical protein [Kitasatospora albolonga]|uniref:hypothetical protein n=1 Tax=Kitasatospora albolonga TaxID=68173 RepID=UPI0031EB1FBF